MLILIFVLFFLVSSFRIKSYTGNSHTKFNDIMLKLTPSTRGSSKGLGVVWSDLKPKAHHRSTQDANDLLNYDQLFQIWDVSYFYK